MRDSNESDGSSPPDDSPKVSSSGRFVPDKIPDILVSETAILKFMGVNYLGICGPYSPVQVDGYGPLGRWLVQPCISGSFKDTITSVMDRYNPTQPQGLLFRIWLGSKAEAKRLECELPGLLSSKGRARRAGWLGPDADLTLLQLEIEELAARLGLKIFGDDELLAIVRERLANEPAA
jgi:hypothetical protein